MGSLYREDVYLWSRQQSAALRKAGNRHVAAIEMGTDHSFSDHRIALAAAVTRWLQQLRIKT